jgi:MFS family permease
MRAAVLRHGATLAASAVVLLAYLIPLAALPKDVFWHPDEGAKFIGLAAIHVGDGIHYELPYPGLALDPELRFYPGSSDKGDLFPKRLPDGRVGFRWPVLFLLLTKPFVAGFGIAGIYVLPIFGAWLAALLAGLIADRHAPPLGPAAVLVVGLATPVAFYGLAFLEHTLAVAFVMTALAVLLARPRGWLAHLVLAACLTVAVVLRAEMLPVAAAFVLAPVLAGARTRAPHERPGRRALLAAVAVTAVAVAALVVVAPDRHREILAMLPGTIVGSVGKLPFVVPAFAHVFVGSPGREAWSINRPEEWAAVAAVAALLAAPWLLQRHPRLEPLVVITALAVLFEFALHVAIASPPFLARQGALTIAPYVAVAGYAIRDGWRQGDDARRVLATAAALAGLLCFLGLFVVRVNPDGSYQVGLDGGSRYLLGLYPLGALLALLALAAYRDSGRPRWARSGFTVLVAGMIIAAVIYEARGIRRLYDSRQLIARWEAALPTTEPVVTDVWWLPAAMAPHYLSHAMYYVGPTHGLDAWITTAAEHGLREFTFASRRRPHAERFRTESLTTTVLSTRFVQGMHVARIAIAR